MIVIASFLATLLVVLLIGEEIAIPQYALTRTHMYIIRTRVFEYTREHGMLPTSLDQLSERDGKGNVKQDEWGVDIIYIVDNNGIVTLKSRAGGSIFGRHKEIVISFPTKDLDGKWRKGLGADY